MTPSSLPRTKHGFVFYVSLISIRSPAYVLKYSALPWAEVAEHLRRVILKLYILYGL